MRADDEAVRALASEILARPEYRRFRQEPSALDRAMVALGEWVAETSRWLWELVPDPVRDMLGWPLDLLRTLFAADNAGPRAVASVLLFVLLVAILVWLGRALLGRGRAESPRASEPDEPASARSLADAADTLARGGRWLEAAHQMQLAVLDLLLRRRWLALDRSEPNRVLRRRLSRASLPERLRDDLIDLIARLESQWFRKRSGDPALYDGWRSAYRELDRLGAAPSAPGAGGAR